MIFEKLTQTKGLVGKCTIRDKMISCCIIYEANRPKVRPKQLVKRVAVWKVTECSNGKSFRDSMGQKVMVDPLHKKQFRASNRKRSTKINLAAACIS